MNSDAGAAGDTNSVGGIGGNGGAAGEAGTGGLIGEAGAAGAGGAEPQPECLKDADCADGLACNGTETCLKGVCKPGVAPCANPEPAHCDAVCKELNGAASCAVQGQDKDKDGHLSSACTVKPGDDCNDAVAAIHPGAPEICDRIDNNCNGKIDLNDGLSVSGSTVEIGPGGATRGTPAIAWATDKSVYGITYYDGTTSSTADLYFETANKTGTVVKGPVAINEAHASLGYGVSFAWGGDAFGTSWISGNDVYFRTVDSSAALGALHDLNTNSYLGTAGLARVGTGNWVVQYSAASPGAGTSYFGRTVSANGAVTGAETATSAGYAAGSSITASSSNFVIANLLASTSSVSASTWNASLGGAVALTVSGKAPIVGSGPYGFAIAVRPASSANPPQFYAFGPTGTALCGPVNIADKSFVPSAIVGTANGYLVISSGVIRVQEILANCTVGQLFTVDSQGLAAVGSAGIAGSAAGYGVVWQDTVSSTPKSRFFGPNFCD